MMQVKREKVSIQKQQQKQNRHTHTHQCAKQMTGGKVAKWSAFSFNKIKAITLVARTNDMSKCRTSETSEN